MLSLHTGQNAGYECSPIRCFFSYCTSGAWTARWVGTCARCDTVCGGIILYEKVLDGQPLCVFVWSVCTGGCEYCQAYEYGAFVQYGM